MTVEQAARLARRETAPWIERLARLGYAAIGLVYAIAGGLTASAALSRRGTTADKHDALVFVRHLPAGTAILWVIAAGLVGYAIWKLIAAIADSDLRGHDAKGFAIRIGSAITGIVYGAVAAGVVKLALGGSGGSKSDVTVRDWTERALGAPFGRALVMIAGLILIGTAAYQFYRAWQSKLTKKLHLESIDPSIRRRVVNVCRFGIAARAIVFAIIGGSLLNAARHYSASAAEGTSGAMRTLSHAPFGAVLLVIIGLGFIAFGVYALTEARYRSVHAS